MSPRIDITGQRFSRLTAVRDVGVDKSRNRLWLCLCDCGNEKIVSGNLLKGGKVQSCGCLSPGYRVRHDPIYLAWSSMIGRCSYPKTNGYRNYGGRGITVCERWHKFENFLADVGEHPGHGFTLDRIDVNGNYEPGNIRWSTLKAQANNRRNNVYITYQGETKTLTEWCEQLGLKYSRMWKRLSAQHMTPEEAFVHESPRKVMVTFNGKTQTRGEWAKELGVPFYTLRYRLQHWPIEKALTREIA